MQNVMMLWMNVNNWRFLIIVILLSIQHYTLNIYRIQGYNLSLLIFTTDRKWLVEFIISQEFEALVTDILEK